jgi:hypothetical protein
VIPGQQFVDTGDWMIGDACDDLAPERFGIVAIEFGGAQQAVHCRRAVAACITAGEQIIFAPKRHAS